MSGDAVLAHSLAAHSVWFGAFRAAIYSIATNVMVYSLVFPIGTLIGGRPGGVGIPFELVVRVSITCAVVGAALLWVLRHSVSSPYVALRLLACAAILAVVVAPLLLAPGFALVEVGARAPFAIAAAMTMGALTPGTLEEEPLPVG